VAEVLLFQTVVGGAFSTSPSTTFGFLRVVIQSSVVEKPIGWGFELAYTPDGTNIFLPTEKYFPFGGSTGLNPNFPSIIKMPVTPGLPRRIAVRAVNQVGIPVDIFAGNETDYF
jgi:hypothetical protein